LIRSRVHRTLLQGLFLLFVFNMGGFTSLADTGTVDPNEGDHQDLDLKDAILQLSDLPPDFQDMPDNQKNRMKSMLDMWGDQLESTNLEILNFTGYWIEDVENPQYVISGLVSPLSSIDQIMIDRVFASPDRVIAQLNEVLSGKNTSLMKGAENLGDSNLAFSTLITSGMVSMQLEYIVVRRGPVLVELAYIYLEDQQPIANSIDLAQLLDDRVAAVVGREVLVGFRPAGPFVPNLTTYIPTPLDVSTQPAVVGTNLLLAAALMLPFGLAAEVFTRTLVAHEDSLQKRIRGISWLRKLHTKFEYAAGVYLSRKSRLQDGLQFIGVVLFYGVVFSLLDSSWKPFSSQGFVLLFSMMGAYGLVGIAGDIIQWRVIKRWGYSAHLSVRPTNLMLAVFSTATSRLFSLVPGLMFGTPEALRTDEAQFEPRQKGRLVRVNVTTLIVIGLGSWLLTAVTTILQRGFPEETIRNSLGGLEAFMLVIFAVTLENLFVQMVGFPGSIGESMKKVNRWVWLASLVAVTFLFYHTLINPRGELARALQTPNVQVTLGIAICFMVIAFGMHFTMTRRVSEDGTPTALSESPQVYHEIEEPIPPVQEAPTIPITQPIRAVPINLSIDEEKICPVCRNRIKSEARVCRFCRASFTITLRGYCLADHDVVDVVEGNRCAICTGEVVDIHVQSTLKTTPPSLPSQDYQPSMESSKTEDATGIQICSSCGQEIRVGDRVCRFCRYTFD
jgi:hypothetical protein